MSRLISFAFIVLASLLSSSSAASAQAVSLQEPVNDGRTFSIDASVQAEGTLKTPAKDKKALELPLELRAQLAYQERRLPSAGREARAWRSSRLYQVAKSDIKVQNRTTELKLDPDIEVVIAEGQREGLLQYAPDLPMRRQDVDLLTYAGDPLCILACLPSQPIEVDETWTVPDWAAQMLVSLEAATSTKLTGKLLSVEGGIARFQLTGEVTGAIHGSSAKIALNGTGEFDTEGQVLRSLKLIQQEERSISTVSPGMKVTATIQWSRKLTQGRGIPDSQLENVPFDPPSIADLLLFPSQHWDITLIHDRNWFVFQEIPEVAVLRLVESGGLISQCNIARIGVAQPGEHVAPAKFEADIQTSLGEQFGSFIDREQIPVDNGNFIYRVVASGNSNNLEMIWIYFLCAAPDGRQISFVFAVEGSQFEKLDSRDISIVESIEFLPVN